MKKIVTLLLCATLCFTVAGLSGCGKDDTGTPHDGAESLSLLANTATDKWMDDNYESTEGTNPHRGLKSFTLSENANALSVIKSAKHNPNDSLSKSIAAHDLSDYKKLIVTAKGVNELAVKLVTSPLMDGGRGYDSIIIPLTSSYETFEFDLSFETYALFRKGAVRIVLYPNDGLIDGAGDISISQLEFSKASPSSFRVLNKEATEPPTPNETDGTENIFNVNKNFVINGTEPFFNITWGRNGHEAGVKTTLIEIVEAKPQGWQYVRTTLSGNLKPYTKLVIKFKANEGLTFKVKLEGGGVTAKETAMRPGDGILEDGKVYDPIATGGEDTFIWDDINAANLIAEGSMTLLFFIYPDAAGPLGHTLEFLTLEFQK